MIYDSHERRKYIYTKTKIYEEHTHTNTINSGPMQKSFNCILITAEHTWV